MLKRLTSSKNLANQVNSVLGKNSLNPQTNHQAPPQKKEPQASKADSSIIQESTKSEYNKDHAPKELRIAAAALCRQGESVHDVATHLNMTHMQVQGAKTSKKLAREVQNSVDRVRELAIDKTLAALGLITPAALSDCDAVELSKVASNCARIVEKTSPQEKTSQLQLVVFTPEQKKLSDFKTLDV